MSPPLNPPEPIDDAPSAPSSVRHALPRALAACVLLLLLGAVLNVWFVMTNHSLDLAGDEAHYWDWSRHLALSYYSKGPLVAWIIAGSRAVLAGASERWLGNELLAVRVPAILLSTLTGLGIFVLSWRALRQPMLALAAVAVTWAIPILAVGSKLMTIDAPFMCAWTWALVCVHSGFVRSRWSAWGTAGVLIALGLLAKYTMVLIYPVMALHWWLHRTSMAPDQRRASLRGWTTAGLIGALGLLPIVIWNAQHNWVSLRHVAGQAGVQEPSGFDPFGFVAYVGGQAGVFGGLWFVAIVWALIDVWRRPVDPSSEAHDPAAARFLVIAAAIPWLFFAAFSVWTKVQPNWPVIAATPGVIVMTLWLRRRLHLPTAGQRRLARGFIAAAILIGGGIVLAMHMPDRLVPLYAWLARDAPPWDVTPASKYDPAARLRGWSQLGAAVGDVLQHERDAGRDPFIMADDYQAASEIAFYCPGEPTTYSIQSALGGRQSQYDIWPNPIRDREMFVGRPCLYVGNLNPMLAGDADHPPVLADLERAATVQHVVAGVRLRVWSIFVSDAFRGFPRRATNEQRY